MYALSATANFYQHVTHETAKWFTQACHSKSLNFKTYDKIETLVISDVEGFDMLEQDWDYLNSISRTTVFQSYPWLRKWWFHFGESSPTRELHIVIVRTQKELIAVCPFYIESKTYAKSMRFRELRFLGEEISDYGDIILKPGNEMISLRAVASHLKKLWKSIDCIYLPNFPSHSPAPGMLCRVLSEFGINTILKQSDTCPVTTLRNTWAETLSEFSAKNRYMLKKRRHQLLNIFNANVEYIESRDDLAQALEDLIRLHQERMREIGKHGLFHERELESFFRDVFREYFNRGWLFLSFLRINDMRVAAACSYYYNNVVSLHISGLANLRVVRRFSPGIVLQAACIERAIQRGAMTYDFMRGTEDYKYRLGAEDKPVWSIFARRVRLSVRLRMNFRTLQERLHLMADLVTARLINAVN